MKLFLLTASILVLISRLEASKFMVNMDGSSKGKGKCMKLVLAKH